MVTSYDSGGNRTWLLSDERQSVVALTNGSGAATAINTYDEYGVPGASNAGRFQYTGQMWLPDSQLYHYRARAYAPQIGRFMQTDPIGYAAGANVYAYVGGDPMNVVDPSGMGGEEISVDECIRRGKVVTTKKDPDTGLFVCDWPGTPGVPTAGSGPDSSGAGSGAPANPEVCAMAQALINENKDSLPSYATDSPRWNDLDALRFELGRAEGSYNFGNSLSLDIPAPVEFGASPAGAALTAKFAFIDTLAARLAAVAGPIPFIASTWNMAWKWEKESGQNRANATRGRITQILEGCDA